MKDEQMVSLSIAPPTRDANNGKSASSRMHRLHQKARAKVIKSAALSPQISFPDKNPAVGQDQEWCLVAKDDCWQRVRFHDYAEIYRIPGLYEELFYNQLKCMSPFVVCRQLEIDLLAAGMPPSELRVLDLGAGNGMVGEELRQAGAEVVVGADILPEAAQAAERDRPGVYTDYYVLDLGNLTDDQRTRLAGYRFNCLTCVAALGFGDIPPEAFTGAFNLIEKGGWIAFNIKEEFVTKPECSRFAGLIKTMTDEGALSILSRRRYRHRFSKAGQTLCYMAFVGRKLTGHGGL
jgi:2-polyprenyl-3-methyl-5-hydroxy-6-metoxy-1,4-benzoquinol methylase